MAVYTDAVSEYLARTANLPGNVHTIFGWSRTRVDRGALVTQPIATLFNAGFTGWGLSWSNSTQASSMVLTSFAAGVESDFAYFPSRPPAGSWFFWFVRCLGSGADQLEAGWRLLGSDTWVTAAVTCPAFTPTQFHLSDFAGAGSFWSNRAHVHVRAANVARTNVQLLTESKSLTPVITTDQNFSWRLASVATLGDTDLSPNNREPTVSGTLADEADPAIEPIPGTATAGIVNGWLATATATDAAGGVAPYTYQWQRSPRDVATWADVTGQTSLNLVDRTVAASTNYDYRLEYTDNNGTQSFSNTLQVNVPAQAAVWTVTGDSQTDEYRADDDRGAGTWEDFVLNWIEQLASPNGASGAAVHNRGLNVGAWGTRAEPRRSGFANIWARSGATMETLLTDQLAGAVAQITDGTSTHAALWACANEWVNPNAQPTYHQYIDEIYNSPDGGVNTQTLGITVAQVVDDVATRITDTIDGFVDANVAGMVVVHVPDYMTGPTFIAAYPDATRRGYVSTAIAGVKSQVDAHIAAINTSAGVTVVTAADPGTLFDPIWATADGTYATVAGLRVNYIVESSDDGPLFFSMVPDGGVGISHPGPIAQSVYANTFLLAANELPGIDVTPLSDQEIRQNAGLDVLANLAATEPQDTAAFTAGSSLEANLAATEPQDTATIAVDVFVTGALAATEPADTAAVSVQVFVTGALAATEPQDTLAATASVPVEGALAATEAADVAAVEADVQITGELAATEPQDTLVATAGVGVSATLAATEPQDTAAVEVDVLVTASLTATEPQDTASFNAGSSIMGNLAATEPADTLAASGAVLVTATMAATEPQDGAAVSVAVLVTATANFAEAPDTLAANADVFVTGALAATEPQDTAAFAAGSSNQVVLAATEPQDTAAISATVEIAATLGATESPDVLAALGLVVVTGALAATEALDVFSASTLDSQPIDIELSASFQSRIILAGASQRRVDLSGNWE